MKFSAASKKSPSAWRDMQRDWQSWSPFERLAAGALSFGTLATAAVYFIATAGF